MILFLATTNQDKLREIRALLADVPATLVGLADAPAVAEPEETGATFEANACLKALYYDHLAAAVAPEGAPVLTLAEDSGLEIDALGGEPGVRSARFVRADASYPERFAEIQRRLAAVPAAPRTARFVCAVAVARLGQIVFDTRGTVEGEIARSARGGAGFGYDPIFYYPPYGHTLAEVDDEQKLRVAHRGHAFRQLSDWLRTGQPSRGTPEF